MTDEILKGLQQQMHWEPDSRLKLAIFKQIAEKLEESKKISQLTAFMNMLPFGSGGTDDSKKYIGDATAYLLNKHGIVAKMIPAPKVGSTVKFELASLKVGMKH